MKAEFPGRNPAGNIQCASDCFVARIVGAENLFVGRILHHQSEDGLTTIEIKSCHWKSRLTDCPSAASDDRHPLRGYYRLARAPDSDQRRNILQGVIKHIITDIGKMELVVFCGIDSR